MKCSGVTVNHYNGFFYSTDFESNRQKSQVSPVVSKFAKFQRVIILNCSELQNRLEPNHCWRSKSFDPFESEILP